MLGTVACGSTRTRLSYATSISCLTFWIPTSLFASIRERVSKTAVRSRSVMRVPSGRRARPLGAAGEGVLRPGSKARRCGRAARESGCRWPPRRGEATWSGWPGEGQVDTPRSSRRAVLKCQHRGQAKLLCAPIRWFRQLRLCRRPLMAVAHPRRYISGVILVGIQDSSWVSHAG